MKQIPNLVIFLFAIISIGCLQKSKTNVNSTATNVPNGKTFVPLPSDKSLDDDALTAFHDAGIEYKSYSMSNSKSQIEAKALSVIVSNSVKMLLERLQDGTGAMHYTKLTLDERNNVTRIISLSSTNYIKKQFVLSNVARYKILILIYNYSNISFFNQNPNGLNIHLLLLDTNTKQILWHKGVESMVFGNYVKDAAENAAISINQQLDLLFGGKKQ